MTPPTASASTACAVKACPGAKPAAWRPVLLIRVHMKHEPMVASLGLVVCEDCILAGHIKLEHFMSDQLWASIEEGARLSRKQLPKRDLTTLDFIDASNASFDPAKMTEKATAAIDANTGEVKPIV